MENTDWVKKMLEIIKEVEEEKQNGKSKDDN